MPIQLQPFEWMYTIVERGKGEKLSAILAEENVLFSIGFVGRGTAQRKAYCYLGVGESEKDIVACPVPKDRVRILMDRLVQKLRLDKPGKGIVFTIPVNRLGRKALAWQNPKATEHGGGSAMEAGVHNLMMVIMNHGYADDVMDTALEAGAPGGTVLRGSGAGFKHAEKFLGITIQPDKDVLMIVAEETVCAAIMDRVIEDHGVGKPAHAVSFSMPICNMAGFSA